MRDFVYTHVYLLTSWVYFKHKFNLYALFENILLSFRQTLELHHGPR